VAAQQGQYVADMLHKNVFDRRLGTLDLDKKKQKPFK
jgi:hypothetical protein